MNTRLKRLTILLFVSFVLMSSCGRKAEKINTVSGELTVFHAGSLSLPMKAAVDSFTRLHPNVTFKLESAGSVECARKISELSKPCDIMASADYKVIDKLLIPQFASWNIPFAGNEMAIVYHEKSRRASEITKDNWFDILAKDDVAFGRSDPNSDPCGYRTVMTVKLAEIFYSKSGLTNNILEKDIKYIRPKEVDLLALLESNTIDYIFLYKSVAIQHGLKYLELPQEINLSNIAFDELYKTVSVEVKGKTPETFITMNGEPMVYGLTIPKNALNPQLALEFVKYFLEANGGQTIMRKMGQTAIVPSSTASFDSIPEVLKGFALKK
ncbi:MAG: tungstate ABC transporter substrate-binding protein WtpA [Bacteroidales bacterium]|nr:MAG: tungstate ABC transporter substrate-binding protein WtpA [Bacteroidales bacterium]